MAEADKVIWLVGPFPPPLHGQAVYNAAMADQLSQHGRLRVLATGEGVAGKLAGYGRIFWAALVRMKRADAVYMSAPGQMAAWLLAAIVAVLRLRGIVHFIHHHSFRPLVGGPTPVMRAIVGLGGQGQHHILLSAVMRDRFAATYLGRDARSRAHALSNAWLFCPAVPTPAIRPGRPPTIGHLSVLTREKGIDVLLRLYRRAAAACPTLRLVIAGPVADPALKAEIMAALEEFADRIEFRGPVAGEAKRSFYADVDLFVLPTRLVDEAEPLVMLESFASGVEFMGTDRGCIAERVRGADRLLTGDEEADVARILAVVAEGMDNWEALRRSCAHQAAHLHACAEAEARLLLAAMLDPR